ncbi:tetratricopeptide repeat protein [Streptomyces sp. NPDC058457]|uniref:tetratricopeptide repeat protein n=1 Tax=Streptomyces sp. NPDC058457 TaxID=3346507 RepID=UPI003647A292
MTGMADASGRHGAQQAVHNEISGGVFFHEVIQGQVVNVHLPEKIVPALSGMPPASSTFTGREREVADLLQALDPGAHQQRGLVTAVAGLAGIGKTELVVQAATRALQVDRWFPGGVLFVDMFGYDPERRLPPERALDGLLRALGIPSEHIPPDLQDRSRLYRSVLAAFAKAGRRVLMVIDNVSTAEQARPLLPSDGITACLITSRHTLDLDARLHDLGVLDEHASVELLGQALQHARGPDDTRVQDTPEDAAAVAALCAGLPLALRIAAALLADSPARPLSSLRQALEAAHTRLQRLRHEDRAVRAAFDLSYQRLDHEHALLLRLLPLNPGPDISTEATARLTQADLPTTEELLQHLARAHLIEPGNTWGRWRLHDLVRLYADELGRADGDDDRDAAVNRLRSHYQNTAASADSHLDADGRGSPRFADAVQALAWLDAEHRNLVAIATDAGSAGDPLLGIGLALSLARFLDRRRYFDDWIGVTCSALEHVTRIQQFIDNRARSADHTPQHEAGAMSSDGFEHARSIVELNRAMLLGNLGTALSGARRFEEAVETCGQCRAAARHLGDRRREGMALDTLGTALVQTGRFDEAIDAHTSALDCFEQAGAPAGRILASLGAALAQAGRIEEALNTLLRAGAALQQAGDRQGEAMALGHVGGLFSDLGMYEQAVEAQQADLGICQEIGDRYGECQALGNLGRSLTRLGRPEQAIDAHRRELALSHEVGTPYDEGQALFGLGVALLEADQFDEAADIYRTCIPLLEEHGSRGQAGEALNNLGGALQGLNSFEPAIDAHTRAAEILREVGNQGEEGRALHNLARALACAGKQQQALGVYSRAASLLASSAGSRTARWSTPK